MTAFDQKFIENLAYLKWVFNTIPAIEHYWEQYLLEHPEEKNQILELKHLLNDLKFSNYKLRHFEKEELANRVILKLNPDMKQNKRRLMLHSFLKYAAIAIILQPSGAF